jgi:hypothetical protein
LCSSSFCLEFDSLEAAVLTRLVPIGGPLGGADTGSVLPESLAFLFISSLLHTKDPFVVTIPAVKSLVRGREPLVTRSCANVFDLVQKVLLLFVESRDFFTEDLE